MGLFSAFSRNEDDSYHKNSCHEIKNPSGEALLRAIESQETNSIVVGVGHNNIITIADNRDIRIEVK